MQCHRPCFVLGVCSYAHHGYAALHHTLGMALRSTVIIKALGDAVLEVSGMTQGGSDATIKKSETATS